MMSRLTEKILLIFSGHVLITSLQSLHHPGGVGVDAAAAAAESASGQYGVDCSFPSHYPVSQGKGKVDWNVSLFVSHHDFL